MPIIPSYLMTGIIRKTVAIEPLLDDYIRKFWAVLIDNGYNASYSTALNLMLLYQILTVGKEDSKVDPELKEQLVSFLNDEETMKAINLEDYATRVDELFESSEPERRKGK